VSVPFLLLTEDAAASTVAEIIESGTWNCADKPHLDRAPLVPSIHNAGALHSLQQERQSAESTRRELGHLRPNTKCLFLTGYAKMVLAHKVVDREANSLHKPYTLKQLSLKIRGALS